MILGEAAPNQADIYAEQQSTAHESLYAKLVGLGPQ